MPKMIIFSLLFALQSYAIAPNAITDFSFGTLPCKIYPNSKIECFQNGSKLFSVNVAANDLIRSPDGKFLLGLSRNPTHAYAFWVLDQAGTILLKQSRPSAFCSSKQPKPVFSIQEGVFADVKVLDCKGKVTSLKTISDP